MLISLALSSALFAPAAPAPAANPAPAPAANPVPAPAATGPAPRILELKPDANGKIMVPVMRPRQVQPAIAPGGAPGVARIMIRGFENAELADVKDLAIITAGGKEVSKEDALKVLAKGGMVVISADGKSVGAAYLKMFKEDVLVLSSPELAATGGGAAVINFNAIRIGPGGAPRPVPAPPVPPVPPAAPKVD
jgi:hypothetical protein